MTTRVRSALSTEGFQLETRPVPGVRSHLAVPDASRSAKLELGERSLEGAPSSRTIRVSVITLLGAGAAFGEVEAQIVGTQWPVLPAIAAAAVVAFVLWFVLGRAYESDVVVATWLVGSAGRDGERAVATVTWLGGHVRSEISSFGGRKIRMVVRVDQGVRVSRDLAQVVRRFETGSAAPPG